MSASRAWCRHVGCIALTYKLYASRMTTLCTQDVKAVSRVRVSRVLTACTCNVIWVKSWGGNGDKAGRDGEIKIHICKCSRAGRTQTNQP